MKFSEKMWNREYFISLNQTSDLLELLAIRTLTRLKSLTLNTTQNRKKIEAKIKCNKHSSTN